MLNYKNLLLTMILAITTALFIISCGEKKEETAQQENLMQNESALESAQKTEVSDATAVKVDTNIPHYTKVAGISGNLSSIGSDTMNNLLTLWLEGFKKYYPNVNIQVEGKGSSTAPPA
ncbi:MAG: phosphate-binding protein, partial [Ignavibacterium sp.]